MKYYITEAWANDDGFTSTNICVFYVDQDILNKYGKIVSEDNGIFYISVLMIAYYNSNNSEDSYNYVMHTESGMVKIYNDAFSVNTYQKYNGCHIGTDLLGLDLNELPFIECDDIDEFFALGEDNDWDINEMVSLWRVKND